MSEHSDEVQSLLQSANGAGKPSREQLDHVYDSINAELAGSARRPAFALPARAFAIAAFLLSTAVAVSFAASAIIESSQEPPPDAIESRGGTTPSEPTSSTPRRHGVIPRPEIPEHNDVEVPPTDVDEPDRSETAPDEPHPESTTRRIKTHVGGSSTTSESHAREYDDLNADAQEALDVREHVEPEVEAHQGLDTEAHQQRSSESINPETLAEETGLIRRAQRAIARHESQSALSILDEHSRRFPQGSLSLERRAARLVARCQLGTNNALRAEAERFLARRSESPYTARIRSTCLGGD